MSIDDLKEAFERCYAIHGDMVDIPEREALRYYFTCGAEAAKAEQQLMEGVQGRCGHVSASSADRGHDLALSAQQPDDCLGDVRFAIMNTKAAARLQPYDDVEIAQAVLAAMPKRESIKDNALLAKSGVKTSDRMFSIVTGNDNVDAWRLGECAHKAGTSKDVGDFIDTGLILLRLLKEKGYAVTQIEGGK